MGRIALVGFAGCGKSHIGKRLAHRLNYDFVDLDDAFEEIYHLSIADFFQKYGEAAFRLCEQKVLNDNLLKDNIVLALGGGTPCFGLNMQQIVERCFTVYVKMSPVSLHHRLQNAKRIRPLTQNLNSEDLMSYIEKTLALRETYYNKEQICGKGENFDLEALVETLNSLNVKNDDNLCQKNI